MSDFLAEKRQEIQNRLEELKPLVEEAGRLEAALAALDGAAGAAPSRGARAPKRAPGPKRGRKASGSAAAGTGKPGRPKGTGKRQAETLALVIKQPGISIPEIAGQTGVQQSYLYRVMPSLQREGLVRKEGRGWYPA